MPLTLGIDTDTIRRILFMRLSAVGDVVFALPALAVLRDRFPDAHIGFLVEDRARDLIEGHPLVDQVHHVPRRRWVRDLRRPERWGAVAGEARAILADIRAQDYDLALDFQGNFKGAMYGLLSGAGRRVGFDRRRSREFNHLFTHVQVSPEASAQHEVDRFLSLVGALGGDITRERYPLPDAPESRKRVQDFLSEAKLEPGGYMALHPGTSNFGKAKRWDPARFAEVARAVWERHHVRSVVTWGPGERRLAENVVAHSNGGAVLALATGSLMDLAELSREARVFLGCDSGPLHLAWIQDTPSVGLYGPKDPAVYGPRNRNSLVVLPPTGVGGAMHLITTEQVLSAIEAKLEAR